MSESLDATVELATTGMRAGVVTSGSSPLVHWLVDNSELISVVMAIGGFSLALFSFIVMWVYKHKSYKLQKSNRSDSKA